MINPAVLKWMISLLFLTGFPIYSMGQKKYLTEEQLVKNKMPAIVVALPQFISWEDDASLVFEKKFNPDTSVMTVVINPLTAKETITTKDYTKPAARKSGVYLKNEDIYFSSGDSETRLTDNKEIELNPELSPDGRWVAFTRNNNLYTIEIPTGSERQLTTDGNDNIMNGYASWVYYEEILSHEYRTFWWSPDSKHLAFFRTDDSQVPEFTITDAAGQHGVVQKQRYPKAGDKNPGIKVGIISLLNDQITWADFNALDDQYFGKPYWRPDGSSLLVQWMNRAQNMLKIYDIDLRTGARKEFYNEEQKTWIGLEDDRIRFLKSNDNCIITSDRSGWNHLYYHDRHGRQINPITMGNFSVLSIMSVDEKNNIVLFTARKENSTRTDLYRIGLNGKGMKRLSFGEYDHNIRMSPTGEYFISTYNNVSEPSRIALLDSRGKFIKEVGNAKGPEFDNYQFAKTELVRVKSEDGLYDLPVKIQWPLEMDSSKRYPVFVDIYGGPGASSVMDFWGFSRIWQWYAKEGVIFISIDHRGSGHFGKEAVNNMYRNLGYWEMKDYSTVVKWLIARGAADPKKISISGYSYGGYIACYALTYGADVFTHGMAGSPVTDWSLYDTHYTERYMRTPLDNPEGYKSSSALTHAARYKGRLLMSHGMMDDNVHMQNSVQLVSKLQDLKKDVEFMIYSGGTHGSMDLNKQAHFINARTQFIYKFLLEKPVPEGLLR